MAEKSKSTRRQARTAPDRFSGTLRIIVLCGEQLGRRVQLRGAEMTVGRDEECEIRFDNPKLSRRHAKLVEIARQRYVVQDLESQNGTFVNGVPVVGERVLVVGDKIRFGTELVVQVSVHDPVEEQLRQRQRFEALGRATAGIAHDFNNLLGAMIANLGYLQRLDGTEQLSAATVADCLADVHGAARRASELSDRLVHFAHGERATDLPIDVGSVCTEVAQLVRRTFDQSIVVETHCQEPLTVTGDSLELHQVLMNLCINARDAMPSGGVLTLRTARGEDDDLVISVTDTGEGMSERTRAQIFHPFFTTKHKRGHGLGLATVREIVLSLGGEITVSSGLGQGTRFDIALPCAPNAPRASPLPLARTRAKTTSRPLHIMVVDDDAGLRRSARRVLTQAGHRVVEAAGGDEALDAYPAAPRPDVVVLDLDMPGLSGEETLAQLMDLDPSAIVVMMSGHRDRDRERKLRDGGAVAFLRKPASMAQMLRAIERAAALRPHGSEEDVGSAHARFSSA